MNGRIIDWWRSGEPWIWLTGGAVSISVIVVGGLILMIAARGMAHFWPSEVLEIRYHAEGEVRTLIGQRADASEIDIESYRAIAPAADVERVPDDVSVIERWLIKTGNRDNNAPDFRWVYRHNFVSVDRPDDLWVLERTEWGNAYGKLVAYHEDGERFTGAQAHAALQRGIERANALRTGIRQLEKGAIGSVNYRLEQLRLRERGLELRAAHMSDVALAAAREDIATDRAALDVEYRSYERELGTLYQRIRRDAATFRLMNEREVEIATASIIRAWQPNAMSTFARLGFYFSSIRDFVTGDPREANTEGGVFPAIFGTVMMVLLMSLLVTPFGVVAAVYLREYARQGLMIRLIRIAVNNLAGVPSIVYGVFGLGFFVYFLGGNIDALFFPEALPAPTFGTPGILWASLTLAILTVPVVIVSTEEGLARIPKSVREGSLALGATKAETLWKIVLPMASPSIMTGVILAIARAAGEVAPLMLVGVVKLAPQLPLDGNFPYVHLDRKFMHLGFHIYDVGFQSPNVEAARPLVYATALLLVVIIIVLNLAAIMLRNRLRDHYRAVE